MEWVALLLTALNLKSSVTFVRPFQQAIMLETLLKHLESAAETNGDAEKETEASNGDSKKDVAPENGASREGEDAVAKKEEPKKDEEAVPAEVSA